MMSEVPERNIALLEPFGGPVPHGRLPPFERAPSTVGSRMIGDDVVERALAGDKKAWGAVVRAHHAAVVAYVQRRWPLVHARRGAEDVVQESWLRIFRRIEDGVAGRKERVPRLVLPGIAKRQARFVALEWLQRRVEDEQDGISEPPDDRQGPDDVVAARETFRRMERALGKLPARERLAWSLYYEEEQTPAEIALKMGLGSEGAARTMISRARRHVLALMEQA
jgi:RNA polymerase sigma-70 factor (ECF subfamily)